MAASTAKNNRWLEWAAISMVFGVLVYNYAPSSADPDLWGHVRFGQDIVREGAITSVDRYAYTSEGQYWVNHEWLTEVVWGTAFNMGGSLGLTAVKLLLILLTAGLLFRHLLTQGLNVVRAGAFLVACFYVMSMGLSTIRPQLFTYLGFAVFLLLIHAAETRRLRVIWWAPLAAAVWINFHGGVLAGVGILSVWAAARIGWDVWTERSVSAAWTPESRQVIGVTLASWAALLFNPYGWRLPKFLLETATVARPEIREWGPLSPSSIEGMVCLALLAIVAAAIWFSRKPRQPALMAVLVTAAVLAWVAKRHVPLFALCALVMAAEHLASALDRREAGAASRGRSPAFQVAASLAFLVTGVSLAGQGLRRSPCIQITPDLKEYPAEAVALLRDSGVRGNVATFFDWGEYLIWHVGPDIKVSIDGRRETVYGDQSYEQSLDFMWGREDWDAILDDYPTDLALVPRALPAATKIQEKPGWRIVYQDDFAVMFAREGSPVGEKIENTAARGLPVNGTGMCFE